MNETLKTSELTASEKLDMLLRESDPAGIKDQIQRQTKPLKNLMAYYKCAMMEVETKFNVLNEELSLEYDRNPIETIKTRIKSPESLMDKMERRGLPVTAESIEENIYDVAGIRVICSYESDIYNLVESFKSQDDIEVIQEKDYIKHPKSNGYRSLHLIVSIPIFLHNEKKMMKVEVQFRTLAMDLWASLEHKIRYKKGIQQNSELETELLECADLCHELEIRMGKVRDLSMEARNVTIPGETK